MTTDLVHRRRTQAVHADPCSQKSAALDRASESTASDDVADSPRVDTETQCRLETQQGTSGEWSTRYLRGGFWVLIGRVLGIGTTLLSNVVMARLMAPSDFGEFLLIVSIVSFASAVAMFGINHVMVRILGESLGLADPNRTRQAFRIGAAVAGTSIVAVGLIAPIVLHFVLSQEHLGVVALVSISIAIMLIAWQQVAGESLRGLHEQRFANLLSGGQISGPLTALLLTLFVVVLSSFRPLAFSDTLWLMNGSLVITLIFAMYCLRTTAADRLLGMEGGQSQCKSPLTVREVILLAAPLMGMQVLAFATTQSDVWIAGIFCGADSVALYGVARRMAIAVGMLPQVAGMAMIAPIATLNAQGRLAEMQRLLQKSASFAALPAIAICLIFIAFGGTILEGLFGPFYRQAASVLAILALGQIAVAWGGSCGYVLTMTGHQVVALLINLATAGVLLAVGTWASTRFNMVGLAWVSTIIVTSQTLAMWVLVRRLVGVWTHGSLDCLFSWQRTHKELPPSLSDAICLDERV